MNCVRSSFNGDPVETSDKIALGVLALILVATAAAEKPSDRYFFVGALIIFLILYLMNKRLDERRERKNELEYKWREEAAEKAYWGEVGSRESPETPEGE